MDQLTFLGTVGSTSAIHSYPFTSGGFILKINNNQLHIDPGFGALLKAKESKIEPEKTNIILVTHNHIDHCNDLNLIIDAITYSGLDTKGVLISDSSVIEGDEHETSILTRKRKSYIEKIITLKPSEKVNMGNLIIKATPTRHRCNTTIGFKFITDKYSIGYTSDTAYFPELNESLGNVDILIINNTFPLNLKSQDHLTSKDSVELIKNINPKLAILTHFGKEMLKANPVYEAREIQRQTGTQVIAARECLSINPLDYLRNIKQKLLEY